MKIVTALALSTFSAAVFAQAGYQQPYTAYGSAQATTPVYSPGTTDPFPPPRSTYPVPNTQESYDPAMVGGAAYTYDERGRASFSQGNTEQAEFSFEKALEVNPFDPVALNNLAVVKVEQGDYYAAIDLLQRSSRLAPNNPEVNANLARLRSWVQTYAITQQDPSGLLPDATKQQANRDLPPAPPPLWGTTPVRF